MTIFKLYGLISLTLLFPSISFSFNIGSDTSPSWITTTPILEEGDRVAAFAALQAGFQLASMSTLATFASNFAVSGQIDLVGGRLFLDRDLVLHSYAGISTLGSIIGNGHVLELAATTSVIQFGVARDYENCNVSLITTVAQPAQVWSSSWSYDDLYLAISLDANASTEIRVYSWNGISLTFIDGVEVGATTYYLDWHPSKYNFAACIATNAGTELRVYEFNGTTITEIDSQEEGDLVTSCEYHPTGDYLATGGFSDTREIVIYPINGDGTLDQAGSIAVDLPGDPNIQQGGIIWNSTGQYLGVATLLAGAASELYVYEFSTGPLALTLNTSLELGVSTIHADWSPAYSDILAVTADAGATVRIYQHDPTAMTLTQIASATPAGVDTRAVNWRRGGTCLSVSDDDGFRQYDYDNASPSLTEGQVVSLGTNNSDIQWSHFGIYLAIAGNDAVRVYGTSALLADMCFTFSDLNIVLHNNLTMQNCCIKFAGKNVISGNNCILDLQETCSFYVDTDSTLLFKNTVLKGISGNCLDAISGSSNYQFQNTTMFLDGNYSFTQGSFTILKDLKIVGNGKTFIYHTDQVSTVSATGRLILDEGVTFSYDPLSSSRNLLRFSDASAELILNSATLHATTTGINLTKGYLTIEGSSFLSAEGNTAATGITFGDNVTAPNNFCIEVMPAASLNISRGLVSYANV